MGILGQVCSMFCTEWLWIWSAQDKHFSHTIFLSLVLHEFSLFLMARHRYCFILKCCSRANISITFPLLLSSCCQSPPFGWGICWPIGVPHSGKAWGWKSLLQISSSTHLIGQGQRVQTVKDANYFSFDLYWRVGDAISCPECLVTLKVKKIFSPINMESSVF